MSFRPGALAGAKETPSRTTPVLAAGDGAKACVVRAREEGEAPTD